MGASLVFAESESHLAAYVLEHCRSKMALFAHFHFRAPALPHNSGPHAFGVPRATATLWLDDPGLDLRLIPSANSHLGRLGLEALQEFGMDRTLPNGGL